MFTISKNDTLFEQYDCENPQKYKDDFSHFGWEGMTPLAFYTYADGYRIAADAIFEKFQNSKGDFAVLDSIVYPLCFNYRHMMELLIKYLHLKYVHYGTKDDLIKSGILSNHDLINLWDKTKAIIEQLQSRVSSNVDIEAVTHYVNEMNKFDSGSFNMRYPVSVIREKTNQITNKKLTPSIAENRLIVPLFHEKMQAFFNAIKRLDCDIDNQVRYDVEEEKINRFIKEFEATKAQIKLIIQSAKKLKCIRDNQRDNTSFDSILNPSPELVDAKKSFRESLCQLSDNQLVLVHTLFYNGLENLNLPNDATEKRIDYIKAAINLMELQNTPFDSTTIDREDLIRPFIEKQSRCTIDSLQMSLDII